MIEGNMNKKEVKRTGTKPSLPVMEQFLSLQGEGQYSGQPAWFIRLAGCDVGCVWCDVKESWDAGLHKDVAIDELAEAAALSGAEMVIVTGGEPLLYSLDELTAALLDRGLEVHLETSGAYPMSGHFHWITLSPKKFKAPLPENLALADELKVVVFHKSDFEWAQKHAAQTREDCRLFLQPEWSKASQMTPLIVEYVKKHPQWAVSLQIHKYLDIP